MTQPVHSEGLSTLDKRKIEAEILKEVYETLKASHGEEVAKKTIAESVRRLVIEQARQFAAAAPSGPSARSARTTTPNSSSSACRPSCGSRATVTQVQLSEMTW